MNNFSLLVSAKDAAEASANGSGGLLIVIVIVVAVLIVVGFPISIFNALVRLRNRVKEAWAQIDVQLKRRYDLIPNLVDTVKGYAKHEKETLENVIKARNQALSALESLSKASGGVPTAGSDMPGADAGSMKLLTNAENILTGMLKQMSITFEQYPDLKANENFLKLQEELSHTENLVAFSRQHFNDEVRVYNTKRELFPNNVFAGMLGFKAASFFETADTEKVVPKVDFT
ncbi:MAG: LemA family protein [Planctomycetes bacterium]|nr:LemA family protein [Planctomycetota bacterium]